MQDRSLYEYAVIRVVPRVEREEFLNLGVVLYCHQQKSLHLKLGLQPEKLRLFAPQLDLEELSKHLQAFEKIANGESDAGPIAGLPAAERFRWLTATRSTIVQTSKVHTGYCSQPQKEKERLFELLVG
jgi:hypothetical protein